jgi:RNA polymerase sigma-70 factor (ECF subfamily)
MLDERSEHPQVADRTNEEWLADLQGPNQDLALSDLRVLLLRGLRAAIYTHIHDGLDTILEDFVQEALIKILKNLETFRGESRFTTWAQKIAINVAFTELRRRRWQNVSLQDMIDRFDSNDFTPAILTDPSFSPEKRATLQIIMENIWHLVNEELTEKQRQAIMAVVEGMPLEEVARRMGTNRNALYKLLHDARKRLKQQLINTGVTPEEVLAIFDNR